MFRIAYPMFLWALCLIPVFGILFLLRMKWKKRAINLLGNPSIINSLMPEKSNGKLRLKFILLSIAYFFLVIGIANPQIGTKFEETRSEGIDLIIALDVSNSMLATDIAPDRLERAKQAVGKLIEKLEDDRIGMVIFAGEAYLQLPITNDYAAAKLFLSNITNESIQSQGTAIGGAIEVAAKALPKGNTKSRAIIIITDGENHEDEALEIAKEVNKTGIKIYTIGIGSEEGSPIPLFENDMQIGFKKDENGDIVTTRMNPELLAKIATAGGGKFIQASNSDIGLEEIHYQIKNMQKTKLGSKSFTDYADRYYYFLYVTLFFLVVEFMILEKKGKFWDKFNLFKIKESA